MCGSGRSYFVELVVRHLADDCMVSDNKHHVFLYYIQSQIGKGFGLEGAENHYRHVPIQIQDNRLGIYSPLKAL